MRTVQPYLSAVKSEWSFTDRDFVTLNVNDDGDDDQLQQFMKQNNFEITITNEDNLEKIKKLRRGTKILSMKEFVGEKG